MHQKTIMGHGAGLPPTSQNQTPTKAKIGARKSSATGSFSQSLTKLGGPNGPVAPASILKNKTKKDEDIELASVSSDEDDLADPDNLGYSK